MSRKDVSDQAVCLAYERMRAAGHSRLADEILSEMTGQPLKVCHAAMKRAEDRGLLDCGVSLRSGWLTDKGRALLDEQLLGESPIRRDNRRRGPLPALCVECGKMCRHPLPGCSPPDEVRPPNPHDVFLSMRPI